MDDKRLNLISIYNFVTALIFIELVLGGLGHLCGYPIRKVLFIIGIVFSLYVIYKEKIKISINFIIPIIIVGIYVVYGSIIGIINGNSFSDIFADANSFLGIIYLILLVAYVKESNKNINKIFNFFVNCSVIVALLTIGLFFFSRIYLPGNIEIINKYNEINGKLQYGLISGLVLSNNYARVYLFNGIFMQLGVAILVIRLLKNINNKIVNTIKISILLIGIYVSNTRGFWIGTIGVFILGAMYYFYRMRKYKLTIKNLIIPIVVLIIVGTIIPKTIVRNNGSVNVPNATESVKDRVESIVDFKNDISNKVRAIQLKFLLEKSKEKLILGWGFGAHIYEYPEYLVENGHHRVDSSNFELYYVELLFKTGIVGIGIFFGYLIFNFIKVIKLIFIKSINEEEERNLVAWTIGTISILISSITNPYIASLSVFFILVMEVYLIQIYDKIN